MKKYLFSIVLFLSLFFGLLSFTVSATTISPTTQDLKTIKVGVYDNYPKIYKDSEGNIKGFWADITNYIAAKENWDLQYVFDSWDNNLKNLENGDIDIMVDVAVSDERLLKYDFNNEIALVSWGIFYSRDGVTINSYQDLEGKRIAIMKSGILYNGIYGLETILTSFNINATVIDVSVYADVFKLLETGEADVGVVNWFFGLANQDKYKVNPTNIIFFPTELKFAFPKDAPKNSYLSSIIDFELKNLKDDSDSIYHNSIKTNFGYFTNKEEVIPKWFNTFLIVIGIVVLLVVIVLIVMRRYQNLLKKRIVEKVKELQKSEMRYKDLYQSLYDAVITLSLPNFRIVSGNDSALKMFGFKEESQLISKTIFDFSPEKQPDGKSSSSKAKQIIEKIIESGPYSYEWVHIKTDKSTFVTSVLLSKIEVEGKTFFQATIRDISKMKEAEQKLENLDECRNKFISVVSHQVRTPLTVIKWSLEGLLENKTHNLTSEQTETIQTILIQGEEAVRRLDDMLETLDIEEGRVKIDKTSFAIDSLLKSIIIQVKVACKIKQIELLVDIEKSDSYLIEADVRKLRISMEHLINNAVSYTKNKGSIKIKLSKDKNIIHFEVTDNGIGIPLTEQANIFTRFYRGSNAATLKPDASGLGLKLTKFYVEQHGGKLGFLSTEGEGSTFWFDLPA